MKPTINLPITGIVLTYNSQQTLESALKSIGFCREIIVVDQESTDQTRTIARQHGAKVIEGGEPSFAKRRNLGLHAATQSWLFYLDSDEVVTPSLAQEIKQVVESHRDGVYLIKRRNFFLGREMYQDRVERLFARDRLHGWAGVVHEHPLIEGERLSITQPLIHRTHTDITSMLAKTNAWSVCG